MSETEESSQALRLPRPSDFLAALGLLTSLPASAPEPRDPAFGRAAPLFPIVGAMTGACLAGIDWLIPSWPPAMSAVLVILSWEALARGALRRGAGNFAFTACIAAAKLAALAFLPVPRLLPLFFAPMLGAWSMVVLAVGARDAAQPGRKLAPGVLFNEFAVASLATFAVVFDLASGLGIFVVVVAAASLIALRFYWHETTGGISTTSLLRGSELIELLTLVLLVPFQS